MCTCTLYLSREDTRYPFVPDTVYGTRSLLTVKTVSQGVRCGELLVVLLTERLLGTGWRVLGRPMGCGASSEAKPPSTSAANPDAGGSVASSAAEPPPSAKRSEASAEASGAPAPGSALFEPEPELKLTKEERHDEIVAGESTVVGGVVASTGNGNDRVSETSQLDRVADESADIENLATISDTSVDVAAATTPSAGIETGGTWSAQSRFSEKLSFSAAEVDQLAKSFAEKDSDQNGTLDFAEFSAHVGTLGEMSPLLVKRLFATFDKDSSGTIDQAEFLAGIAACCTGSKEEKMSLAFVRDKATPTDEFVSCRAVTPLMLLVGGS